MEGLDVTIIYIMGLNLSKKLPGDWNSYINYGKRIHSTIKPYILFYVPRGLYGITVDNIHNLHIIY